MLGLLYINNQLVGEVSLKIIDESMGVIGGHLTPSLAYGQFRQQIQECYARKGVANSSDFNLKMMISDRAMDGQGGISITNSLDFPDEIEVDIAGVSSEVLSEITS